MIFLYITAIVFWMFFLYCIFRPFIHRLELRFERTFWGITLTLWDRPCYYEGYRNGKGLFTFKLRDPENDDINKKKR